MNVESFFSPQMIKLVKGPMSNAQLKLLDDNIRIQWCAEQLVLQS